MTIPEYLAAQPVERQELLTALHEAIIANDKTITPVIEPMMGAEMILYKEKCYMKYGLASMKKHMSVHCLPMYMNPPLHAKYVGLLPDAKFQKGCFNFSTATDVPVEIVGSLIADCEKVSIAEMIESRNKKKK